MQSVGCRRKKNESIFCASAWLLSHQRTPFINSNCMAERKFLCRKIKTYDSVFAIRAKCVRKVRFNEKAKQSRVPYIEYRRTKFHASALRNEEVNTKFHALFHDTYFVWFLWVDTGGHFDLKRQSWPNQIKEKWNREKTVVMKWNSWAHICELTGIQ